MSERNWDDANEKRDLLNDACVMCGKQGAELAHIIGRSNDKHMPLYPRKSAAFMRRRTWNARPWIVHPDRVTLLCGPSTDTASCHGAYDAHRLDILSRLTLDEQLQAVADAGGVITMLRRVTGRDEVAVERLTDDVPLLRELP